MQSNDTKEVTPNKDSSTWFDIENESATTPQVTSSDSSQQTSASKKHWRQPKTVRQFASQVNTVATKVLNGELDMETARVYSSLTRVLAQAISSEVTKARFVKEVPDLTIDDDMVEEGG